MAIYVAIMRSTVAVYDPMATGDATPIRSISGPQTGLDGIEGMALDSLGNLYTGNAATSTVTVYDPTANGNSTPIRTIGGSNTGLGVPGGLALDSSDNLYVLNTGGIPPNRHITVYSPAADGNVAPLRTLTGIQVGDGNLNGIAIDWHDNLYLAEDLPERISVYPPRVSGPVTPIRVISGPSTQLDVPATMAFDNANNLYVSNGNNVLVFDPRANGDVAPIRVISGPSTGLTDAVDVAVDQDGYLYVGNLPSDFLTGGSQGRVTVYPPGASGNVAPIRTISGIDTELGVPFGGIAIDKPRPQEGPVWVDKNFWLIVYILFGVIQGGGGVVLPPGGPPIPIGPGGPVFTLGVEAWQHLGTAKQDVLTGLAIMQMAEGITDAASRRAVEQAGLATMQQALRQLER